MTKKIEETPNQTFIPYTYLLFHRPTKKYYYGCSYSKNSNPTKLWVSYFSSSKVVKELIKKYGKESFDVKIRKVFTKPKDALVWETKFLNKIDARNNDNWLNLHNGDGNFITYGPMNEYQKNNISKAKKGKLPRKPGFTHSEETKEKIRISNLGKHFGPITEEHKQNIRKKQIEFLKTLSKDKMKERMLNSCHAPDVYTLERANKIRQAKTGVKLSKEHCNNISKSRASFVKSLNPDELKDKYGKQHKGKTWKIVDGKRKWFSLGEIV